jgi:hypothetical protein
MRIRGRVLLPQDLRERRLLKSLGVDFIRVPRRQNPFAVARLVRKLSFGGTDMPKLKAMLAKRPVPIVPSQPAQLPDSTSSPRQEHAA